MKYCIGVDLGGTNIAVGLIDLDGRRILHKKSVKTRAPRPCEEISSDIKAVCLDLCQMEGISLSDVLWIGIATPGIVRAGVVISAVNLGWSDEPFGEILSRITGRPTFVANDANAAAYAEAKWGCGVGEDSLIAITLGTGIGGGIILDGKIWEGFNGFAAELGHMVIAVDGRHCACGLRGCFEAYCSATALVHETRRMMKLYPDSLMWEIAGGDITRIDGRTAFKANSRGDFAAHQVIEDFVNYLAIGIANIINIFQPSVVCLGGGISGQGEELMRPLRERLRYTSFGTKDMRTRVEAAVYKNDAGIIGAGLLGIMED
ncbi:MAG: ROK family protein [Clostridia bacterium]|nr:ROK family protein [Clostridia bacterium]